MSDLYNEFPSWGETGEYPPGGFFYEGGDQVNEKHLDALWNGVEKHVTNLNDAISDRVADIEGDLVLDSGLVASLGNASREVDVTATALAYVGGERVTNVSSDTVTVSSTSSSRKDVVYLSQNGSIEVDEGTTSAPAEALKIAEVDVDVISGIVSVDNYAQDCRFHTASENNDSTRNGDLWYDITNGRIKVQQNGGFQRLLTEQNDITITTGDGLDGGVSNISLEDPSMLLSVDVSDFAGSGIQDDGSNNLELVSDTVTVAGNTVSLGGSTNIALGDLSNVTATGEGDGGGFNADTVDGKDADQLGITQDEVQSDAAIWSDGFAPQFGG